VLPYGNSNYDFLDIEQERTKSASYYFFSFRRMFGAIDISYENNRKLVEKAGREGFIEDKAYRQFRNILRCFFHQLAADYFRSGDSPEQNYYKNKKSEYNKRHKAKKEAEINSNIPIC
jgi:hypothetical protein